MKTYVLINIRRAVKARTLTLSLDVKLDSVSRVYVLMQFFKPYMDNLREEKRVWARREDFYRCRRSSRRKGQRRSDPEALKFVIAITFCPNVSIVVFNIGGRFP
jgi:hypothetical protein